MCKARLSIAHRGGVIAIDGSEVSLSVDERIAHHPVLRHAHQCWIDDLFAMGMEVAGRVAGNFCAFSVLCPRRQIELPHGI